MNKLCIFCIMFASIQVTFGYESLKNKGLGKRESIDLIDTYLIDLTGQIEGLRQDLSNLDSKISKKIDNIYYKAMKNGSLGGKILGAGAGGFLLFYSETPSKLRNALKKKNLKEVRFKFDFEGVKQIL